MKKKILSLLMIGLIMTGCGTGSQEARESQTSENQSIEPDTDKKETETENGENVINLQFDGQNGMANSIATADLLFAGMDDNGIFSPLSLNLALGMLAEGAEGQSKDELLTYLGTEDYGSYAQSYLAYCHSLNEESQGAENGYSTELDLTDSLWINSNLCSLKSDYRDRVSTLYQASVMDYDFTDKKGLCQEVNQWCSDSTKGMIPSILSENQISDANSAILANALYYEAPWETPFTKGDGEESFATADGEEKTIYLYSDEAIAYYENEEATAFAYPYANGMYFIGILPKEEGNFSLSELDIPSLLESKTTDFDSLSVKMPALDYEVTMDLTDTLKSLGLATALGSQGQYGGISEESLCVDSVLQKAKIKLDENGTQAAAVTEISMMTTALPPENTIDYQVYLDRSYAYLIYDEVHEQILFIGKVNHV